VAEQHGKAGRSAYWLSLNRAVVVIVLLGALGAIYLTARPWLPARVSLVKAAPVVAVLASLVLALFEPLRRWSDRAERGGDAEHTVGSALKALPADYHVIHDLAFEGFNIDHVVIGPTGIFTVETKSHRGRVRAHQHTLILNGQPANAFLDQTWRCAYAVRDLLQRTTGTVYPIRPILCFPNAYIEVRHPVKGIVISSRPFLRKVILYRQPPPHLGDDEIRRLASVLSLTVPPSRWTPLVM
jgi:uncharacterized membrane protein YhaH (DUF805 family)